MRKIGLVTFCATTCVLVPAALHQLVAGQQQIDKLGDPELDRFTLGSAKISVALDRYILGPGETLNIHVAAANAPAGSLELGVLVLGSSGNEGDRVPSPPVGVAHKMIKLDVKDGVAQAAIAVPLKGAIANEYQPLATYQVFVGPKAAIAKLERLRKNSHLIGNAREEIPSLNKAGNEFMTAYWNIDNDPNDGDEMDAERKDSPYTPEKIARVEAHVRPKSDAIALTIPPTAAAAEQFTAMVSVTNPSRRKMTGLEVSLDQHQGFGGGMYDETKQLTIEPEMETIELAPGETKHITFKVTGKVVGVFGLLAHASCDYEQVEAKQCRNVQSLELGTFDATELVSPSDKKPTVAALTPATK